MNTTVLRKSNLKAKDLLFIAWLNAGLCFFLGCASPSLPSKAASSIDAHFQLERAHPKTATVAVGSPSVLFYQKVLSSTLASHCTYFPSDSRYAMRMSKRCGPGLTMMKSFERYSREFDAGHLGLPVVSIDGENHFKDIPNECEWIN